MFDIYKMKEHISKELDKKAETGIKNMSDLETVGKLLDDYKDLCEIEAMERGSGYSRNNGHGMADGYSERLMRDSGGRYARDGGYSEIYERGNSYGYSQAGDMKHERYMESKHAYRSSKTPECKQRLMDTVEDRMGDLSMQIEEMLRDADCREERETIKRYLEKIKAIA